MYRIAATALSLALAACSGTADQAGVQKSAKTPTTVVKTTTTPVKDPLKPEEAEHAATDGTCLLSADIGRALDQKAAGKELELSVRATLALETGWRHFVLLLPCNPATKAALTAAVDAAALASVGGEVCDELKALSIGECRDAIKAAQGFDDDGAAPLAAAAANPNLRCVSGGVTESARCALSVKSSKGVSLGDVAVRGTAGGSAETSPVVPSDQTTTAPAPTQPVTTAAAVCRGGPRYGYIHQANSDENAAKVLCQTTREGPEVQSCCPGQSLRHTVEAAYCGQLPAEPGYCRCIIMDTTCQ